MTRLDQIVSEQFSDWEKRGRGWDVYPEPVAPEPPFRAFQGYSLPEVEDDGRRPTFLNSVVNAVRRSLSPDPARSAPPPPEEEPLPDLLERSDVEEIQIILPANLKIDGDLFSSFISSLDPCREPVSFEIVGTEHAIILQVAAVSADLARIKATFSSLFPEAALLGAPQSLREIIYGSGDGIAVVDFGLEEEFMLPLATQHSVDPLVPIFTALSSLTKNETAIVQITFQPTRNPWPHSALRCINGDDGKSLFRNHPRLPTGAKEKFKFPLFAVVIRLLTCAETHRRSWALMHDLAFSLRTFANPDGNALIPLDNDEYEIDDHVEDFVRRQSRRTGMLLNAAELLSFVHLPSSEVRCSKLKRQVERTKAAPGSTQNAGIVLGNNEHLGKSLAVALSDAERTRHIHIIGASGTGKSTLLFNLIQQDILNGQGIALLDPHGDLVDRVLTIIPENRVQDVILIDPADEEFFVGFNILSAHSDLEKNLLASDLVSVFERLSTSWGDQMASVLQNAILAFLESERGGTIADLRRFLIDAEFRNEFLGSVRDPEIVYYWRKGFAQLTGNKSIGPVLTRLETFLAPKPIRYMVAQRENRIDFADILNSGKIFLAKLPQGQIGKENSFLLGSLIVAKFQQLAMGRQAQRIQSRRPFFFYIDEFHNFITPSMAEILSGARKYSVGLVLAHQELRQLERDREVASAVMANCYTRIVFRVGDADARTLESGFGFFESRDLQNLEIGHAICRIERADNDFNLTVPLPDEPTEADADETRRAVIDASRNRYGTPRAVLEERFRKAAEAKSEKSPLKTPQVSTETGKSNESSPSSAPAPALSKVEVQTDSETMPGREEPKPQVESNVDPFAEFQIAEQIKTRIIQEAGKLGFSYREEQQISDRKRVDLVLTRGRLVLACEISATTSADHEIENILKCVRHGYARIFQVCENRLRRARISSLIATALTPQEAARVQCVTFSEFIRVLKAFPPPDDGEPSVSPPKSSPPPSGPTLSTEQQKALEKDMLAELRRKLRRDKT